MRSDPVRVRRPQVVPEARPEELGRWLADVLDSEASAGRARGGQAAIHIAGEAPIGLASGRYAQSEATITDATRFCTYSVSKMVVATAVHLLVGDGRINYADQVCTVLPRFAARGKSVVTIFHLLTHQAGIPDVGERVPVGDYVTLASAVDAVCVLPLEPSFGRFEYHKLTAYALLAAIVERVAGRDFAGFCRDRIFDPLGMTSTTWGISEALEYQASEIHGVSPETDRKNRIWREPRVRPSVQPSMGLYSTACDIARFLDAWLDMWWGRTSPLGLAPAHVHYCVTIHAEIGAGEFGYGLGFMVGRDEIEACSRGAYCSAATFGHPGRGTALAYADPLAQLVVVLLLNIDIGQPDADARFGRISDAINLWPRKGGTCG
jgi:CubicO group peptidase (beta-lactamase class C family)